MIKGFIIKLLKRFGYHYWLLTLSLCNIWGVLDQPNCFYFHRNMALAASWTIAPSKGKNISEEVKLEHSNELI